MTRYKGKRIDNGEWVRGNLIETSDKIRSADSNEPFSNCWIVPVAEVDMLFGFGGSLSTLKVRAFIVVPETVEHIAADAAGDE